MEFTESVRSFQVPATPGTFAWPPSRPSVPTSRATRVTSPAKRLSWSTIVLMVSLSNKNFAAHVHGDLLRKVAVGDGRGNFCDVSHLTREVRGHGVHIVGQIFPGSGHAGHLRLSAETCLRCRPRGPRASLRRRIALS